MNDILRCIKNEIAGWLSRTPTEQEILSCYNYIYARIDTKTDLSGISCLIIDWRNQTCIINDNDEYIIRD